MKDILKIKFAKKVICKQINNVYINKDQARTNAESQ